MEKNEAKKAIEYSISLLQKSIKDCKVKMKDGSKSDLNFMSNMQTAVANHLTRCVKSEFNVVVRGLCASGEGCRSLIDGPFCTKHKKKYEKESGFSLDI